MFSSSLTEKVRFQVITSPLQEAMDTGEQLRVVVEGVTLGGLSLELSTCTHWLVVFEDTRFAGFRVILFVPLRVAVIELVNLSLFPYEGPRTNPKLILTTCSQGTVCMGIIAFLNFQHLNLNVQQQFRNAL